MFNDHKEEEESVEFEMEVTGIFDKPLKHIINESIRIKTKTKTP